MCKLKQPWRHAASIIVAASRKTAPPIPRTYSHPRDPTAEILEKVLGDKRVGPTPTTDVSILMVKRRPDSKFMPGAYTFPGGALDPSDFDAYWAEQFLRNVYEPREEKFAAPQGGFRLYLQQIVEEKPGRPPAMVEFRDFNRKVNSETGRPFWMPGEWAFKLCAIRELFEETGILVCRDLKTGLDEIKSTGGSTTPDFRTFKPASMVSSLQDHRDTVIQDPSRFKSVCQQLGVLPAFWLLREWSNWLSPSTYSAKHRFDTLFYVLCLEHQEIAEVQQAELDKAEWIDPKLLLRSGSIGEVQLAPPQIYELARLARFETVPELNKFVKIRDLVGLNQIFPLLGKSTDDIRLAILPGDDLYPKKPDYYACDQPLYEFDKSAHVLREISKNLHRAEFKPSGKSIWSSPKLYMNIKPACNHVKPIESFQD